MGKCTASAIVKLSTNPILAAWILWTFKDSIQSFWKVYLLCTICMHTTTDCDGCFLLLLLFFHIFSTSKSFLRLTLKWKYFSVDKYNEHIWMNWTVFSFRIIVSGSTDSHSEKKNGLPIFLCRHKNEKVHVYFLVSSFWMLLFQILS